MELRVSLIKPPYRRNKRTYALLEEARAIKLLKVAHIKIGWLWPHSGGMPGTRPQQMLLEMR